MLIRQRDDESADTLVPRLQTLHAEMDRIVLLTVNGPRNSGDDRPQISLTRDFDCLKKAASIIPDCRLTIIDASSGAGELCAPLIG